tara:strand:- start:1364 stop:1732 length:369 start_codon:yes stop_codon:yes gene_type:complete
MPGYEFSNIIVTPPKNIPCEKEYKGAVEPAFDGLLKIVTNAKINPIMAAGIINEGIFHPTKAPPKHKDSKIPVLLTAPSRVILSLAGRSYDPEKFFVNAGLPDLPKVLSAECLDIINLQFIY